MFNILIFNFDVNTEVNTVLILVPCFACQSRKGYTRYAVNHEISRFLNKKRG